jgi:hydroxyquinol 1,2-dioxygenase
MLGALGRHPYRPAHLHCIIEAAGHEALTTHVFDPDDAHVHSDAVFGLRET